ncbi:hypothetical protein F4808DRAFT_219866 [Astrocystis sublimbata]|nr:hypothetical protein F4808DRAFT_219866 [Astrocystis sublimbata]
MIFYVIATQASLSDDYDDILTGVERLKVYFNNTTYMTDAHGSAFDRLLAASVLVLCIFPGSRHVVVELGLLRRKRAISVRVGYPLILSFSYLQSVVVLGR